MSEIEKLTVTLEANVAGYNADLAKATQETQRQTQAMENSFAKLGTFGARTPQTFDKIASGMASVGKSALQTQVANELAGTSAARAATEFDAVAEASGHVSTQSQAAFHSLRAMAEGLALGMPPSQVLTQQLNHLTYAASGPGGLAGAFKGVGQIFAGILTPFRLVAGGIAGATIAAVSAAVSFSNSQSKIQLALEGVGKASGVTAANINEIAASVSSAGDISRSEAADIATAIASTGKASADVTEKATGLAHAYSLVFNKDLAKSAQDLGDALADPARGIDALSSRLGAWNAKQVELVKNLTLAGDREAAQKIILDGMEKSIGDAASKTTLWARAWDDVTNAASNFFNGVGKTINATTLSPQEAFDQAQARLTALQGAGTQGGVGRRGLFASKDQIDAATAALQRAKTALDAYNASQKETADNQNAIDVSNIVKGVDPTVQKLNELQATIDRIKKAPVLDNASEAVRDKVVQSLQTEHDFLQSNLDVARQRYGIASAQLGIDAKAAAIEIQAISARTPQQKADVAYQQTLNQLLATGVSQREAEIEAGLARTKSLTQAEHDLSEAQRDRIYQAGQSVEQQALENQTIGLGVGAATTLTQRFQLLAAAKAEAQKNGTVISPEELAAMDQAAIKLGKLAETQAALKAQSDARFDISQLGRSQSEQSVYSTLNSAGLLTNGEIVSAQAQQTAAILRTKEALTQLADVEKGFASDFLHDLIQGKSAAAALGDALSNVASKLLDTGIDKLISGATGSGVFGGIGKLFGFADGGIMVPGQGPLNLPRFANGGVSSSAAIFAEAGAEAAVPLPDGRSIPVTLRGPKMPTAVQAQAAAPQVSISIDARNSTPQAVDKLNSDTIPQIRKLVRTEIAQAFDRNAKVIRKVRGQ